MYLDQGANNNAFVFIEERDSHNDRNGEKMLSQWLPS